MTDDSIPAAIDPVRLWQQLSDYFSLDDLRTLCFTLGIDFENLPGEGKEGKARELVIFCRNRAMVDRLVEKVRQERPGLALGAPEAAEQGGDDTAAPPPEQRLYQLVVAFNRNRHQPRSSQRNRTADEIAFQMRALVPEVDGRFDVDRWLHSDNVGKRVAAVSYLDWKQDTEYFRVLLDRLPGEQPFIQFHILLALNSLLEQLPYEDMQTLRKELPDYDTGTDSSRTLWKRSLINQVEAWFKLVE